jgi:RNA polymerase sigma factor (TIGR02999 family)
MGRGRALERADHDPLGAARLRTPRAPNPWQTVFVTGTPSDPLSEPDGDVTRLLAAARDGDSGALDALFPHVYRELRELAQTLLREERASHTLQATALVHEVWLRIARQHSLGVEHHLEFLHVAAQIMRRVLVDHARRRGRLKRGEGRHVALLDDTVAQLERSTGDLVTLDEALESLTAVDARKGRLVELRFFAGLDMHAAADALRVSLRQAERDWTMARAYLKAKLEGG